jgi:hypothetical protein
MKLPCPWDGCPFSTFQKSNLETHYRRQYVFVSLIIKNYQLTRLFIITCSAPKERIISAMTIPDVILDLVIHLLSLVTENVIMDIFLDLRMVNLRIGIGGLERRSSSTCL